MYEQHLAQTGLTKEQAAIYEALVRRGPMQASVVARHSNVPRTFVYAILSELKKLGLVASKKEKGSISTFSATHPFKLQELARNRVHVAEQARASVEATLAAIVSDFNATSGQPGIRILEGIDGVRELYSDILRERQPVALIRSPNDTLFPELRDLVERQKKEQARLGIATRVLTSKQHKNMAEKITEDKKLRVTRRTIADSKFIPPAQVIVYANKVALTAYDEQIITTIIENRDIRSTLVMIFEYMWHVTKAVNNYNN